MTASREGVWGMYMYDSHDQYPMPIDVDQCHINKYWSLLIGIGISKGSSIIAIIFTYDDFYRKRGSQKVVIEMIVSENYDNDGRPLMQI